MRIPMRTLSRQTRYTLEGIDDILVYKVGMTTRFRGVTCHEGLPLHGHTGWGGVAPFWSYDDLESPCWPAVTLEPARRFPSVPRRKFMPVNVTIPAISPEKAHECVKGLGGCAVAEIKVTEPGVSVGRSCVRIAAVAGTLCETVGGQAMIRLDTNSTWEVDQAREAIPVMATTTGTVPIEYTERPHLTMDELARVCQSVDVPIAADESIRRAKDPLEVARKEVVDVVITKVAPLGGVRAALKVARKGGLGVIVSSVLGTSVGPSVSITAAVAMPGVPWAARLTTAPLLADDMTQPLTPERDCLPTRRLESNQELIGRTLVDDDLVSRWGMCLGGMAEHLKAGSRQVGRMSSIDAANTILSPLNTLGITHVLHCPDSRSTPFAYALEAGSSNGDARPILDGRGAGFAAVGLTRTGTLPAVIVTSGIITAELTPATLEVSHICLPLLIVSADHPGELRDAGTSQATHQSGFFGMHVRASIDLEHQETSPSLVDHLTRTVVAACGASSGTSEPVQISIAFYDPLTPVRPASDSEDEVGTSFVPRPIRVAGASAVPARWEDAVGPAVASLIVAGEGASPRACEWSGASDFPLLTKPASGMWRGGEVTPFEQSFVSPSFGREVDAVVVTGRPTLSRPIQTLFTCPGVRIVIVDAHIPWMGVSGNASAVAVDLEPARELIHAVQAEWASRIHEAARDADERIESLFASGSGRMMFDLTRSVAASTNGPLTLGAPNPVRAFDLAVPTLEGRIVHPNRGQVGVDDVVTTIVGTCMGSGHMGETSASVGEHVITVTGDLTACHGASSLALVASVNTHLDIIVADDQDDGIFATLEHGRAANAEAYDRWSDLVQSVDCEAFMVTYGVAFMRADAPQELESSLAHPANGPRLIHVPVERTVHLYPAVRDALS